MHASRMRYSVAFPIFKTAWEDEYVQSCYNPREMKLVSLISAIYFLGHFLGTVFWRGTDDVGGGRAWLVVTWLPELVVGLQNGLWVLLLSLKSWRAFCVPRYNAICTYIIVSSYVATIVPSFVWETRLAKFQTLHPTYLHLSIDYASFRPNRTCIQVVQGAGNDLNSLIGSVMACNSFILSGTSYITYIFWNLLPRICRARTQHAIIVAFSTFVILLVLSIAVGVDRWAIATCTLFQLATGLAVATFCQAGDQRSRDKFAMVKATQFAAEQNRALLYTLIPPNVVRRLATHTGDDMLGRDIPLCTIMFCSLHSHAPLVTLDKIYAAFDAIVQYHGAFKYQHVGKLSFSLV